MDEFGSQLVLYLSINSWVLVSWFSELLKKRLNITQLKNFSRLGTEERRELGKYSIHDQAITGCPLPIPEKRFPNSQFLAKSF